MFQFSSGLIQFPYIPVDLTGSVLEGETVYYACSNTNEVLNDGSGLGVFAVTCINQTLQPEIWPKCEAKV